MGVVNEGEVTGAEKLQTLIANKVEGFIKYGDKTFDALPAMDQHAVHEAFAKFKATFAKKDEAKGEVEQVAPETAPQEKPKKKSKW